MWGNLCSNTHNCHFRGTRYLPPPLRKGPLVFSGPRLPHLGLWSGCRHLSSCFGHSPPSGIRNMSGRRAFISLVEASAPSAMVLVFSLRVGAPPPQVLKDFNIGLPRPLAEGEERHWVEGEGEEVECVGGEVAQLSRPCVARDDHHREYEMPRAFCEDNTPLPPYRLHTHVDQGLVGWSFLVWAYRDFKVNGVLEPDKYHVTHGAAKKAMQASGLYPLTLATTIVMKSKRGPFGGGGFLGSLQVCVLYQSSIGDHTGAVFLYFYPTSRRISTRERGSHTGHRPTNR